MHIGICLPSFWLIVVNVMGSDELKNESGISLSPQNGSKGSEVTFETSLLMDDTKKKRNPEIVKLGDQNTKGSRSFLFTRKQFTALFCFCLSNFLSLACVSLQGPFYPKTVSLLKIIKPHAFSEINCYYESKDWKRYQRLLLRENETLSKVSKSCLLRKLLVRCQILGFANYCYFVSHINALFGPLIVTSRVVVKNIA